MAFQSANDTTMTKANLPENMVIFLAGGAIFGDVESLLGVARDTDVTGFYIAGGVEFYLGDNTMAGVSGYYNALEADTPLGQDVDSNTYAVSFYLRHRLECQFRDRRSRPKLGGTGDWCAVRSGASAVRRWF